MVLFHGRDRITLHILGDDPRQITLLRFTQDNSELALLEVAELIEFSDPQEGFELGFVLYKPRESSFGPIILTKKIFVKQLLNPEETQNSSIMLGSSSNQLAVNIKRFPWTDFSTVEHHDKIIDVAIWNPDIKSSDNKLLEHKLNDLASNKSGIMGHLYADGTFRVTEVNPEAPWLVNVRTFTAWIKNLNHTYFLVANHYHKSVLCINNFDKMITLPGIFSPHKISEVVISQYTENPELQDTFFALLPGLPYMKFSLSQLMESNELSVKYRVTLSGVWHSGNEQQRKLYAEIHAYPRLDLESIFKLNTVNEKIIDESSNMTTDISGHCYPINNLIKIKVRKSSLRSSDIINYEVPGTLYTTDILKALIVVIDNPNQASSSNNAQQKMIYVMIDGNLNPSKNHSLPLEEGFEKINFTGHSVQISYPDKLIEHSFESLVYAPLEAFKKNHLVNTFDIVPHLRLGDYNYLQKCIISVWKDLSDFENNFCKEIDDLIKKRYSWQYSLPIEHIDSVHLYLRNHSLWVVNQYEGVVAVGRPNIIQSGWFLERKTDSLLILKTLSDYIYIYNGPDEKQYVMQLLAKSLKNGDEIYYNLEDIVLNEAEDSLKYISAHLEQPEFTVSFSELISKIINTGEKANQPMRPNAGYGQLRA